MYRLATKCTTKNELPRARNAITVYMRLRLRVSSLSTMTRCRSVWPPTKACAINSTGLATNCRCRQRCADCGRRSAVIVASADWQQMDFLFRGRDVAVTMNSVKILRAVRSAITAIAELLVYCSGNMMLLPFIAFTLLVEWHEGHPAWKCPALKIPKSPLLGTWSPGMEKN